MDDHDDRGHADAAGDQMHSELDAIQQRLRALKRKLDARRSVADVAGEPEMARGDALSMNPLTPGDHPPARDS